MSWLIKVKKQVRIFAILLVLFIFFQQSGFGQLINQWAIYRQGNCEKFMSFQYENDALNSGDEYYSQGFSIELIHPSLKKSFLNNFLLKPDNFKTYYGLVAEHNLFTPSNIQSSEIIEGERPYASCLMLKSSLTATHHEKDIYLVSAIIAGVIGHLANGDCMQIFAHQYGNNFVPLGWEYQIKNDIILNYQVNYNRKIIEYNKGFVLYSAGELRVGTLHDMVSAGLVIIAGKHDNQCSVTERKILTKSDKLRKADSFFLYSESYIRFVAYDATLQGGVFGNQSPAALSGNEIERFVWYSNSGIVMRVKNLHFEYFYSFQSRDFKTGNLHSWGGFKFGFSF